MANPDSQLTKEYHNLMAKIRTTLGMKKRGLVSNQFANEEMVGEMTTTVGNERLHAEPTQLTT